MEIFFGEPTNFGVNFWCIPQLFQVYYFSRKQEACMSGCHPSYLKTVSQRTAGFEPTPFDFWLPTPHFWLESYRFTQILVAFKKWLIKMVTHQKIFVSGK
jgi:hypothetical protein